MVCKQRLWLVPELNEANQMLSLQTGLQIRMFKNELLNIATNLQTLQNCFINGIDGIREFLKPFTTIASTATRAINST